MNNFQKIVVGPLAWAICIITGGLMITSEGIELIKANPALGTVIAVIAIGTGIIGVGSKIGKKAEA